METRFLWKRISWPSQIIVWLFSFYIAWNLIPAGFQKLLSESSQISLFESLSIPLFLLIIVGIVEILGPVLMFIPKVSFYGSSSVFVVMSCATYLTRSNFSLSLESILSPPLLIAIISLIIAVLTRPGLLRKKPNITKISI